MQAVELLPALRHVEIVPVRADGSDPQFALVDRSGIARQALALSAAGYFIAAHLDGRHAVADMQAAFLRELKVRLDAEQILELVRVLDENLLLETPRFEAAYAERLAAYRAAGVRESRATADQAGLRDELRGLLASGTADGLTQVRGLAAPHLDYARGAPAYADAYAALSRTTWPRRFVLLGTNHFGRGLGVVATGCAFATPLGRAEIDLAFLERLEAALGVSLRACELDHLTEHSIELQVNLLQALADGRGVHIVPLLCPYPCGPQGLKPDRAGPDLSTFAETLAGLIDADGGGATVIIAGADLSHVGRHFGDPQAATPASLRNIAQADRLLLDLLARGELPAFVRVIQGAGNPTRICSPGCLYVLRHALRERPARLLRYHQATNFEADMHVTCAALAIL
jgi:AmmeMemoRadiSam system protein B